MSNKVSALIIVPWSPRVSPVRRQPADKELTQGGPREAEGGTYRAGQGRQGGAVLRRRAQGQERLLCGCRNPPARARSTLDYQGNAFKLVPKGTCTSIKTPKGEGSLSPKA